MFACLVTWYKLQTEGFGLFFDIGQAACLIFLFIGLLTEFDILGAIGKHGVIDPSDFVSGGGDGVLAAVSGFDAAVKSTEGGFAACESDGSDTEGLSGSICFVLCLSL